MGQTMPTFDERFPALVALAYRVAFRLLGDRREAEDVAQEALARAYARWPSVRDHDEPWVARVSANLAIGRWRRQRPTIVFGDEHSVSVPAPDARTIERLGLLAALARLPPRQREVIALRYLADLPEREVATAMRTSVGTVKQHAHRALARLRLDLIAPTLAPEVDDV